MTITPEQIKQLAEAQRDNPELDLLRDYDGDKIDVLWVGEQDMAARLYAGLTQCDIRSRRFVLVSDAIGNVVEFSVRVTDAGREWLRVNGGEWIEAGGKACKVRVRYNRDTNLTKMQCTHIDERLRGRVGNSRFFVASNGWRVVSSECPCITDVVVWIRGHQRAADDNVVLTHGNHVPEIKFAVDAANAAWEKELATVPCCVCGKPVDTRDTEDGGDEHGSELSDGRWACSHECWDKAAGPLDKPSPGLASLREAILAKITGELDRAYAKHGRDAWGRHEFWGVLAEEVDELMDAIKTDAPMEHVLDEAAQVACVCIRYMETGDRYRGQHPTFSEAIRGKYETITDMMQAKVEPEKHQRHSSCVARKAEE